MTTRIHSFRMTTLKALVRLIIVYGLLIAPWPGLREGYAALYADGFSTLFHSFGSRAMVLFRPLTPPDALQDTRIEWVNLGTRAARSAMHNARFVGYLPTALLLAMVLATPIPWPRRLISLFFGLLCIHLFVIVRVLIVVLYGFSGDDPSALYHPGPVVSAMLAKAQELASNSISVTFGVPLLVWIIVAVRRSDVVQWRTLSAGSSSNDPAGPTSA